MRYVKAKTIVLTACPLHSVTCWGPIGWWCCPCLHSPPAGRLMTHTGWSPRLYDRTAAQAHQTPAADLPTTSWMLIMYTTTSSDCWNYKKWNEMNGVFLPQFCTVKPTWANEINFVMNQAPGACLIARPANQKSNVLPLSYGCHIGIRRKHEDVQFVNI